MSSHPEADVRDQILGLDEQTAMEAPRINELSEMYKTCFSTQAGRAVLADLYNRTVGQADSSLEPMAMAFHSGRRNVVQSILLRIGAGRATDHFTEGFIDG